MCKIRLCKSAIFQNMQKVNRLHYTDGMCERLMVCDRLKSFTGYIIAMHLTFSGGLVSCSIQQLKESRKKFLRHLAQA